MRSGEISEVIEKFNKKEEDKILLYAEHVNFSEHNLISDWGETKYTLYKNGVLLVENKIGRDTFKHKVTITEKDFRYIEKNINTYLDDYISAEPNRCFDGTVWEFVYNNKKSELGYIYGLNIEKIAKILIKYKEVV